ncbi:MAG TPA: adenylate/guanylate cyclase domain-containing protein [Candidatus Sulfomarinibacteraceae bacterium]|nr:adenylate/guanylate cyclase domain-containing protein [Candidatus Sulfomarinibacteraceae bacterium]
MTYLSQRSESAIAVGWLRRAERLLDGQPESAVHAWLLRPHLNQAIGRGELEAALVLADRILEIGVRLGDRDLGAIGLQDRGRVLVALGRVDEGMDALDEAVVMAISGDVSPYPTAMVYCNATIAAEDLTDFRRAGEFAEAAKRWCERQAISGFPGMCRVRRVEIIRLRGAWEQAETEARRACTELIEFQPSYAGEGFYQIGEIRRRMGDLAGAEDAFAQAHRLGRDPMPGLALVRHAQGRSDAAASLLARALGEPGLAPLVRARLLPAEVEVAIAIRDVGRAEAAAAMLESTAATYRTNLLRAEAGVARGLIALATDEPDAAIAALRGAIREWQAMDAPYEAALAQAALGEAYRATGDDDAAALEFAAAGATFESLGAAMNLRRISELTASGTEERGKSGRSRHATRTFMFTDIVGSTGLIDAVGDEAWGSVLGWHDATIRALLRAHRGQEVHHAGDGFFVAFEAADDALGCAIAIRRAFLDHRRDHGFAPSIRIGLHTAEALHTASGYEGSGVHAAARIGALAVGEEILASRATLEAARPTSHGPWRTERLRGFRAPVEIAAID